MSASTEKLEIPEVTDPAMVFGGYNEDWFHSVLKMSEKDGDPLFVRKASDLFFHGGTVDLDESLPKDYLTRGTRMVKCVLGSFAPKHEHKQAVVGYILQNICRTPK